MKSRGAEGAAVLGKAFALFERMVADRGNTALAVMAREMGLPSSTVYRFVTALERAGWVCRVGRGRYDVGIRIVEMLAGISAHDVLVKVARPVLDRLARQTRATVHLGIWEGDMVTYLVKTTGRAAASAPLFTREHTQLEAYCTGIGKMLLAHQPHSAQQAYVTASPFVALTSRTITEPAKLLAAFKLSRKRGYATDDGETADDLYCIAVPLRYGRQAMAAVSLAYPRASGLSQPLQSRLLQLNACASEIRRRLGQQVS
ncbi:MAG: IclR family transcriptional regulator [Pseudomonadota bacterium]|nr:IclR family transcriptional regulator [Pseudomonadota bacterium]